jgi:hypothetical protein
MDCPADAVTFQDGKFLVSVFAIRVADAGADVNARLIREAMETRFERRDSRGEIREARCERREAARGHPAFCETPVSKARPGAPAGSAGRETDLVEGLV